MSDYKITLPDGTTFEAPTAHEVIGMAKAYQTGSEGEMAFVEKTLEDSVRAVQNE